MRSNRVGIDDDEFPLRHIDPPKKYRRPQGERLVPIQLKKRQFDVRAANMRRVSSGWTDRL